MGLTSFTQRRALLALLAAFACASVGAAEERKTVRDLEYGHSLFHFYQEDYFESAARLLAAQEQGRVSHHVDDADLLLGGIYLSYGQQRDANAIFERLLDERVDSTVRDRAWLYAAQLAGTIMTTAEGVALAEKLWSDKQ